VTAASLGLIGAMESAHAVSMGQDGTGEVLIIPYYNVNNNFVTNIGITNTTNLTKVIKLRFRESGESQDVLDFNVYMSPYDQWTASLRINPATGAANLITVDESCTYPRKAVLQGGVDLLDVYDNVTAADVTEGYVEIFEMGVIADGPGPAVDGGLYAETGQDGVLDGAAVASQQIAYNVEHVNGMPRNCEVVFSAWNNGGFTPGALVQGLAADGDANNPYDAAGANNGVVAPTGGLAAYSILLNTVNGSAFVQEATALNGYSTVPQHYRSDDQANYLLPSLASGNVQEASIISADGRSVANVPTVRSYYDTGSVIDISPNAPVAMGANPFPVALSLSAWGIANQYFVDPIINGSTDWVVTFPMRKHGIWNGARLTTDLDGNGVDCGRVAATRWPSCAAGESAGYNPTADDVLVSLRYWDAEESEITPDPSEPIVSPPIQAQPDETRLTREVNVLSFSRNGDDTESVLGTPEENVLTVNIESFTGGWAEVVMDSQYNYATNTAMDCLVDAVACAPGSSTTPLRGVPTLSFSAMDGYVVEEGIVAGETVNAIRYVDRP
jgi:hypothetical protein